MTLDHHLDGALDAAREAVTSARELADGEPGSPRRSRDLAVAELALGDLFILPKEPLEAVAHHREASRRITGIAEKMPGNRGASAEMARCLGVLGKTMVSTEQNNEARECLTEAREIWLELKRGEPLTQQQEAALAGVVELLTGLR